VQSGEHRKGNIAPAELVDPSLWTIGTLYIHFLRIIEDLDQRTSERFDAGDKQIKIAMDASEKAINKAEAAAEKRLEILNESRGQLRDQAGTFVTKSELSAELRAMAEKISDLSSRVLIKEGKGSGLQSGWLILVAAITLILMALGIFIKNGGK
jgi:hypothetical protein